MQWLNSVLVSDPENQESIKNLRENWPCKTFQGFIRANKTDKAIQRMKIHIVSLNHPDLSRKSWKLPKTVTWLC